MSLNKPMNADNQKLRSSFAPLSAAGYGQRYVQESNSMAIWGCSLQEVAHFSKEVEKLRVKLREDKKFKERVLENDTDYDRIKNFFEQFLGFLNRVLKNPHISAISS